MLDGIPNLPGLVAVSVYDTNMFIFSRFFATPLNGFRKKRQVYDPEIHFDDGDRKSVIKV